MYSVRDWTASAAGGGAGGDGVNDAVFLRQPGRTEERLLWHLLGGGFDVDARGVDHTNTTVTVRIQFLLLRIQGLVGFSGCRFGDVLGILIAAARSPRKFRIRDQYFHLPTSDSLLCHGHMHRIGDVICGNSCAPV